MAEKNSSSVLVALLVLAIVVSVGGVALNVALLKSMSAPSGVLSITGFESFNTSGSATFSQNGTATLGITDPSIQFADGFVNATCDRNYAILDSENTTTLPDSRVNFAQNGVCWVNRSEAFRLTVDFHELTNNGTIPLNVTAQGSKSARDFICGTGATCDEQRAIIMLKTINQEANSCSGQPIGQYLTMSTAQSNGTVRICDSFSYIDTSDLIRVFINLSVPHNALFGSRTLTIEYQGLAA